MGSSAPDPLLTEAVAELYGGDPQGFTDRRKTLAAAARAAGDAESAKRIAALRKPTRAAWVVNRLARHDTGAPARLASLAAALRAAEEARDGSRLRELSAARGSLIDAMARAALAAAGVADPPAGLRDEVTATLTAALADPEVAAAFAAGTLTHAAEWAGFGIPLSTVPGTDDPGTGNAGTSEPGAASVMAPVPLKEGRSLRRERDAPAARASVLQEREREQGRAGEARQRLAEEAAQVADRRRKIFEDAERAVASAASAATGATAAEDRLEVEVRDLEERLTRARAELADARLQARRAEAAERKARRVLEHLPRPDQE